MYSNKQQAIFIDKDGTLIDDVPYNVDPVCIRLAPTVQEGLRLLSEQSWKLVVISNQSGIALNKFQESALAGVNKKINELLAETGVAIDAFYYCPHLPGGTVKVYAIECNCRKPAPGLILKAALDLNIDLAQSWMIGDILNDAEAGNAAGCRTVLIDNGNETEWLLTPQRQPGFTVKTFLEAAQIIAQSKTNPAYARGTME